MIDVLSADYGEIEAMEDVFVPDELLSEEELDALEAERSPAIVSATVDEASGVYQRVLSNGVRVNYRVTNNEPGSAFLRLVIPGGRRRSRRRLVPAASAPPPSVSAPSRRWAPSGSGTASRWNSSPCKTW